MTPRCRVHRVTTVTCCCMKPKQPHTKLHKASLPHLSPPSEIPSKAPPPRLARVLAWDATEIFPPLFLALGGVLGLLFAVLMPPLQVPDELAHFFRAFAISNGTCMTPAEQAVPLTVHQLLAVFPSRVETHHPVRFQDYKRLIGTRWMDGDPVQIRNLNASCLLYTSPSPRDGLLSRMPSSA